MGSGGKLYPLSPLPGNCRFESEFPGWGGRILNGDDRTIHLTDEELARLGTGKGEEEEVRSTHKDLISSGFYEDGETGRLLAQQPPRPPAASSRNMEELRDCTSEFTLLAQIGSGGQGIVWEALQHHLGRTVAVKQAREDPETMEYFIKESLTAAQLDHPNIVPVYDLGLIDANGTRVPLLAMKRVVGRSWRTLLEEDRKADDFNLDRFLMHHIPIFIDVANAVAFAHSRGIIHRDLKPDQVMVGDFGEVYLLDWGLAVFVGDPTRIEDTGRLPPSESYFTLDSATNPAGTPAYMAPEQTCIGPEFLGFHTDIYLLGAILYEMLTGNPPHRADSVRKALLYAETNKYPPLPDNTPPGLAELTIRCMESSPTDRPKSALEVRHEIEAWLTGAGKRNDSRRLTGEVAAASLSEIREYGELSSLARKLGQATQYWPENPEIPSLRQALIRRFSEVALEKHDFLLAQLQAGRLADSKVREGMNESIEEARVAFAKNLRTPPIFSPLRVTLFVFLLLIVGGVLGGILRIAERSTMDEIHSQARAMAALTAGEINPATLLEVDRHRNIESPEFQAVFSRMNTIRRANPDIRYIYTMVPSETGPDTLWRTLVDADPYDVDLTGDGTIDVEGNPPGTPYPYGIPEMREALLGTEPTSAHLRDRWGEFISGFAPIRDRRTGAPIAIAAVDFDKESIDGRLYTMRVSILTAGILIYLLLGLTFFAWSAGRRSLERVRLLREMLERQERETKRTDIFLG